MLLAYNCPLSILMQKTILDLIGFQVAKSNKVSCSCTWTVKLQYLNDMSQSCRFQENTTIKAQKITIWLEAGQKMPERDIKVDYSCNVHAIFVGFRWHSGQMCNISKEWVCEILCWTACGLWYSNCHIDCNKTKNEQLLTLHPNAQMGKTKFQSSPTSFHILFQSWTGQMFTMAITRKFKPVYC